MKPAEVITAVTALNDAISGNDEEKQTVHLIALLGGIALNLARLVHGHPAPPAPPAT